MKPRRVTKRTPMRILVVFDMLLCGGHTPPRQCLMNSQESTSLRRNLFGSPWRIPHNLDVGFDDARQVENFISRIGGNGGPHTAPLGSERHLHVNARAIRKCVNMHIVDKAKVDNVDRNFGIVASLERLPDSLLESFACECVCLRGSACS